MSTTPSRTTPSPSAAPVRVFILDDHEVVRRGVRDLLEAEDDIEVGGAAGGPPGAGGRAPRRQPPGGRGGGGPRGER
ncbi:hypothetical protein ACFV6W_09305, partial [Streptomyces sp. NPDC059802]